MFLRKDSTFMKRILTLALALAMLLPTIACSTQTTPEDTAAATDQAAITTELDTSGWSEAQLRALIPDNLPARDFNSRPYRIASEAEKSYEIISEELNGEVTNDSIYNRNLLIEDRFKVKLENVVVTDAHAHVNTTVTAGDNAYEVVGFKAWLTSTPVMARSLLNWYDISYTDFTRPWYYKDTNDGATINGRLFNATCSLGITTLLYTYSIFFNTRICTDFGYDPATLYNLVYNNEWVYDKFYSIVSTISVDLNGDSRINTKDVLGYACGNSHPLDVWLAAFDIDIMQRNEEGSIVPVLITEKTLAAFDKISDLTFNTPSCYLFTSEYQEFKLFANAHVALCPSPFRIAFSELRDMEDTYGVLPYPKWDAQQDKYRSHIYDQYSVFAVPKSVPEDDWEFVGIIFEALNAESYKSVYPAYYDVALKNKYSEDEDTANMIDIINAGAGMEFSFMFSGSTSNLSFLFRDSILAKVSLATKYKTIEKVVNKSIAKLYTYYED